MIDLKRKKTKDHRLNILDFALFISPNSKVSGGAEIQFKRLYSSCKKYLSCNPKISPKFKIGIYHVKPNPIDLIFLLVYIIKTKPKVVILNHSVLGTPPVILLLLKLVHVTGILYPHLVTSAYVMKPKFQHVRRFLQFATLSISRQTIAISEGNSFVLAQEYKYPQDQIIRAFNYPPLPLKDSNQKNLGNSFAIIGRLQNRHKRQLDFLEQCAESIRSYNLEVLIFGDGPDYTKLKKIIATKSLEDNVRIISGLSTDDIFQYKFKYVINCSSWEGLSLAILEAMQCRRMIIASNIPGNIEVSHPSFRFSGFKELETIFEQIHSIKHSSDMILDYQDAVLSLYSEKAASKSVIDVISSHL